MLNPMRSFLDFMQGKLRIGWHEKRLILKGADNTRILEAIMENWYKIDKIVKDSNMDVKIFLKSGASIAEGKHDSWLENLKAAGRIYLDWHARETNMQDEYAEYPLSDITWG